MVTPANAANMVTFPARPRPLGDKLLALINPGTVQRILVAVSPAAQVRGDREGDHADLGRDRPLPAIAAVDQPRGGVHRPE